MTEVDNKDYANYAVTSKDDGYHPEDKDAFWEWWYFDANFSNGYSVVVTYHSGMPHKAAKNARFIEFGMYDPDEKKRFTRTKVPIEDSSFSVDGCDVKMGAHSVKGDAKEVRIIFDDNGMGYDLTFKTLVPGFLPYPQGHLHQDSKLDGHFSWACMQPRAKVKGHIIVDGEKIEVQGGGYHDHNWGTLPISHFYDWWYWLRIVLPNHTFVCTASTMKHVEGVKERDNWVVGYSGDQFLQWCYEMEPEWVETFVEEKTGATLPKHLRMNLNDPDMKGTIDFVMKDLLEVMPMPGDRRGYFRFMVNCHVNLKIGDDVVDERIELVSELMKPS